MKKHILFFLFVLLMFIFPIFSVSAEEIKEGYYVITSALSSEKVLDLKNEYANNGSNIQLYQKNYYCAQKWYFKSAGDGYYYILSSVNKDYAIDINAGKYKNGTNIQLYQKNGTNAQKFKLVKKSGYYYLQSYNSNYVIDILGAKNANGTNIQLYKKNGSKAQLFKLEYTYKQERTIDNGIYKIKTVLNTEKVLDITAGRTANKTNIQLYQQNSTNAQKWEVTYLNNGYYRILSYSGYKKSLDVAAASKSLRTNVQLYDYYADTSQQWLIHDNEDGTYTIVSRCNNLAVDVNNLSTQDGTNIQMYSINDLGAQDFVFEKIENPGVQTVNDGYYFIRTGLHNYKYLDVLGGYMADGTNVQLYDANYTLAQKWYVKYVSDGYYAILADKDQNYALTVTDTMIDMDNIYIQAFNNLDNQLWMIRSNGDGSYGILSKNGKYLDVYAKSTNNGTNIQVYSENLDINQKLYFIPTADGNSAQLVEDGLYYIESSLNPNMVVDVTGGQLANRTNIQLYQKNGSNAQKWRFTYLSNGYYKITSLVYLSKSLDVSNMGTSPGTNVQLYDYNGTQAQQWIVKDAGDGYFYIVSNCGGQYLDVNAAQTYNGTNIQMYTANYSGAQKFSLTPTEADNKVIDVSAWNGNITWSQVKTSKIYGVILRVAAGCEEEDSMFATYIAEVKRLNIPYGLYIYSYAENYNEGVLHAKFMADMIKKYDLKPTLGIYLDLESNVCTYYMGVKEYTNVVNGFLSVLPQAHLYTYKSYADSALNSEFLRSKITWIAQYYEVCTYSGSYNMWQYTETGRIAGVPGDVDISYMYRI